MAERVYLADKETLDTVKELVENISPLVSQLITPQTKKFTTYTCGITSSTTVTVQGSGSALFINDYSGMQWNFNIDGTSFSTDQVGDGASFYLHFNEYIKFSTQYSYGSYIIMT